MLRREKRDKSRHNNHQSLLTREHRQPNRDEEGPAPAEEISRSRAGQTPEGLASPVIIEDEHLPGYLLANHGEDILNISLGPVA